jgi:hypothetical protein
LSAYLIYGPPFDRDPEVTHLFDNFVDAALRDEAEVARTGRRDVRMGDVLGSIQMEIDFLIAEMQGVAHLVKHNVPHSKDPLIKLNGNGYISDGKDCVVESAYLHFDLHSFKHDGGQERMVSVGVELAPAAAPTPQTMQTLARNLLQQLVKIR